MDNNTPAKMISPEANWIDNASVVKEIKPQPVSERHIRHQNAILLHDQPCAYCSMTGRPLEETFLTRGVGRQTIRFPFTPEIDTAEQPIRVLEEAVFVSFYNSHFGHLLTESLANSWHAFDPTPEARQDSHGSRLPLIIQNYKGEKGGELLRQLAIDHEVIFAESLQGRTLVRQLHTAAPTLVFGHGISRRHLREVRRYLNGFMDDCLLNRLAATEGQNKVYLSRQKLEPALRHLRREDELATELAAEKWQILHPQEMSISDQLASYANARVIAGNVASAFHLLMGLGEGTRTLQKKHLLCLVGAQIPRIFPMQFELQQLQCDYLRCLQPVPHAPEQTTNLTLIDQEFTLAPSQIAAMLNERADQP